MRRRDDQRYRSAGANGVIHVSLERRRALRFMLLPAACWLTPTLAWAAAARISSTRLWPAQEYTRLILESSAPIPHQLLVLKDPHRVVLDLEDIKLTPELLELPLRVQSADPY